MARSFVLSTSSPRDCDQKAAVVARTPLPDGIHRTHRHGLVESSRRADVVELVLSGRWGLFGGGVRGAVAGIRWETLRRGGRLPEGDAITG